MDGWGWAMVASTLWCAGAVLLSTRTPFLGPTAYVAWGVTVFTSEAALDGAGQTSGTLTPVELVPLAVLALTTAVFMLHPRATRPALTPPLRWAVIYVAWLGVCALFSPAPVSAGMRIVQIGLPLLALVAARLAGVRTTGYLVAAALGCMAHVVYAVVVDPHYVGLPGDQRLSGLLIANTFGLAAGLTVAASFGLWLGMRGRHGTSVLPWAAIVIGLYALVQSAARTAAIAIVVAVIVASWAAYRSASRAARRRAVMAAGLLLAGAAYVGLRPGVAQTTTQLFVRSDTDVSTLTGRVPLWGRLLQAVADHPVFGFGPSAYRDHALSLTRYLTPPEAGLGVSHNALIEALVAAGVMGGLLWLGLMIQLGRHLWRLPVGQRPAVLAIFAVIAVSSITTSSAAGIGIGWYVALALAALDTTRLREGVDDGIQPGSAAFPTPSMATSVAERSTS
jgi:O-antigen ligase